FCSETREAVKALPARLEALARDPAELSRMRHALRQLWMLYNPKAFTCDIEQLFASQADDPADAALEDLPMSTADLLEISKRILNKNIATSEEEFFLLAACASRALLDTAAFARVFAQHEVLKKAL